MTFIEVMIAMTILLIGLMSVFTAMGTSSQVKDRANHQGRAVQAIQEQIERYQAMSFTEVARTIPVAPSSVSFDVPGVPLASGVARAGEIRRELTSTSTRLHLTVTVTWEDIQGPASLTVHYHHVDRGG